MRRFQIGNQKIAIKVATLCIAAAFANSLNANPSPKKKSVILLISDGASSAHFTLARWYKKGTPLSFDFAAQGMVRTYSASSIITDSAAAATAIATGFKTTNGFLSVLPESPNAPAATILEAAARKGLATGLVATSQIQHATPAAFSSHIMHRDDYQTIAEQQVYLAPDVMLGGGKAFLDAAARSDGENLVGVIKQKGYDFVTSRKELAANKSRGKKLWGAFAPIDIAYDFERNAKTTPSLAEMTEAALAHLESNPNGFFLMVEGSKIDWASHANNPVGVVSEVLSYEAAFKVALDFAKQNPGTVVIGASDHGTGGLSITGELPPPPAADARDSSDSSADVVMPKFIQNVGSWLKKKTTKNQGIGWTTGGHVGDDVPLYCWRAQGACINGVVENTDIARFIATELDIDLKKTTDELFVSAKKVFSKEIRVTIDRSNASNPSLKVIMGEKSAALPANRNTILFSDSRQPISFSGITMIQDDDAWIPREAVEALNRAGLR